MNLIFLCPFLTCLFLFLVPTLPQEGSREPCCVSPRVSLSHEGRRRISSGSSRRTSRLTCAQLLALSGTQGAALAASCASNFAVHRFCSGIGRGMSVSKQIITPPEIRTLFIVSLNNR